jgi:hypothetical protein
VFQILQEKMGLGELKNQERLLLELKEKQLVVELKEKRLVVGLKEDEPLVVVVELKEHPVVDCQQQVGSLQRFEMLSCSSLAVWLFRYLETCVWSWGSSSLRSKVFHTGSGTEPPCLFPNDEGGKGGPCPHGKGHRPHRLPH